MWSCSGRQCQCARCRQMVMWRRHSPTTDRLGSYLSFSQKPASSNSPTSLDAFYHLYFNPPLLSQKIERDSSMLWLGMHYTESCGAVGTYSVGPSQGQAYSSSYDEEVQESLPSEGKRFIPESILCLCICAAITALLAGAQYCSDVTSLLEQLPTVVTEDRGGPCAYCSVSLINPWHAYTVRVMVVAVSVCVCVFELSTILSSSPWKTIICPSILHNTTSCHASLIVTII